MLLDVRIRLFSLLILFVLLGAVYSLTTPLFEAPDEVWHYAYVRYLAEERALPALTNDASGAYQEVAQPPLYPAVPYELERADGNHSPVERAIRRGLAQDG